MEGVASVQKVIAITGDGAAFTCRQMLGVLEAETGKVAEDAALASLVFGEPGLTGILNDG
jgi:hypothetical protein